MSFYGSPKQDANSLKFNSPKVWRPEAITKNDPLSPSLSPSPSSEIIPPTTPTTPQKNENNNNNKFSSPTSSPSLSKSSSASPLARSNSALFSTLGFDMNDDIDSDDSSGDDMLDDDKFAIPSPRKPLGKPKEKEKEREPDKSKTVPIEQYNELKALVAEREKERDQVLAAKAESEANAKQTQKHQLGILRDSFKKQMDEKDRKLEDLELLLAEASNGASSDTASTASTAMVSLKLKIERLEKEKQALEEKVSQTERMRSNSLASASSSSSVSSQQIDETQKELKQVTEAKTKLEGQLEKARNDIFQLQHEKDLSAKELLTTKNEIDKLLNSTKSGSDSINFERKINAEIGEKLNEQKKENEQLTAKITSLEAKLESVKSAQQASSSTESANLQSEIDRLEKETERLEKENSKSVAQIEDWKRKANELDEQISFLSGAKTEGDSEKAKNAKLVEEINALKKERDEARSAATDVTSNLSDAAQSKKLLESKNSELSAELQRLTDENKAQVAALERELKDLQDNQAKMKDLYSKQMNESSSSFQGERVELLNSVSELQTQVQSLKNTTEEKDKLLREAARNVERLEQASLQKDLEIREKSDSVASSKSESDSRKFELAAAQAELKKREGEIEEKTNEIVERKREAEEAKKEVALLKEERRNLSAGSVSERENNERERKDLMAQFDKAQKSQLQADHAKETKALENKYKKQIEDIEHERKTEEDERNKQLDETISKHKKEVQELTASHARKLAELESAQKDAASTHTQGLADIERKHAQELADTQRKHAQEISDADRAHKIEREDAERARKDAAHAHSQEIADAARKHAQEISDSERANKEEREKRDREWKEEKQKMEEMRGSEVASLNKKFEDYVSEVKKDKAQKEADVKKEIEELKAKYQKETEELKSKYQKELDKAAKEKEDDKAKLQNATTSLNEFKDKMSKILKTMASEIKILKQSLAKVRSQAEENQKSIPNVVQLLAKTISKATVKLDKTASEAVKKYKKEVVKCRKLYNEIQELKGNIRVYCRVRPLSNDEVARRDDMVVTFPEESVMIVNNPQTNQKKTFEFEKIYSPELQQEQIFKDTEPLITSVVDGYNVCIFAYGQTGSGKTYTMEGTKENPGVNLRALNELFRVAQERAADYKFEITVSVLEIYNETIHDLLVKPPKGNATPIKYEIKQGPNGMYVPDLTSVQVHSAADVLRVMALGAQHRATSSTNMNEHSSRSHALLSVVVTTQNLVSGTITIGKLTLVDLAGSERVSKSGVTKERMTEAQNINKSLSALGDVIAALAQKNQHIPYRNSKLTYLLQDSLGGDSKTLMFVQISPSSDNVGESLCSLNFAARVRSVELGQAKKHVGDTNTAEVAKMKAHIRKLEDQLGSPELRSSSPGSASDSSPRPVKKKVIAKT